MRVAKCGLECDLLLHVPSFLLEATNLMIEKIQSFSLKVEWSGEISTKMKREN
jgi:hypothetical protein